MTQALKIVLATSYFPAHLGGLERVAHELARRLAADHGFRIDWAAAASRGGETGVAGGITCHAARAWNGLEDRTGLPMPVWSVADLRRLVTLIRDADAVHIHDYLYPANIAAMLIARRHRKPVVMTQHIGEIPFRSRLPGITLSLLNRTLGRWMLKQADQTVFISDAVRSYFSVQGRFRRPPLFWPNGVDLGLFHPVPTPQRSSLRASLNLPPDGPLFLFAGRFVEKKGLPLLRRIAARMPEAFVVVAGDGPFRPEDWALPNVIVRRGLSQAVLAPYYQCADLFVLPSRGEGFPLVIQEAMACGAPVLTNRETLAAIPGIERFVAGESVEGGDAPARWSEQAMKIVSESSEDRRQARRHYAETEWSWDAVAARYAALFQSLASGRR